MLQIHPRSMCVQLYQPAAALSSKALTWKDLTHVAVLPTGLFWLSPPACVPSDSPALPSPGLGALEHAHSPWGCSAGSAFGNRNSETSRAVAVLSTHLTESKYMEVFIEFSLEKQYLLLCKSSNFQLKIIAKIFLPICSAYDFSIGKEIQTAQFFSYFQWIIQADIWMF